jgi:NMD protein affecting ribosome stability and mRNA decay
MTAWLEPASFRDSAPRILKFCKTCQKDTAHEIRVARGVTVAICVSCVARALSYELDRD